MSRTIVALLIVAGAFAVLISLGNWQMRRLAWKEDLITRVSQRMAAAPVDLTGVKSAPMTRSDFLDENEYRPAIVSGNFVPDATVRAFTTLSGTKGPLQGPGYWVLTPIRTESGVELFINRGFVPFDHQGTIPEPPAGTVEITGVIRAPELGNYATPEADQKKRIWYVRDVAEIADAVSPGGNVLPYFIDADASLTPDGGIPQAGETRTSFSNSHLQYAITWYGLAAALLCVFGVYILTYRKGAAA